MQPMTGSRPSCRKVLNAALVTNGPKRRLIRHSQLRRSFPEAAIHASCSVLKRAQFESADNDKDLALFNMTYALRRIGRKREMQISYQTSTSFDPM